MKKFLLVLIIFLSFNIDSFSQWVEMNRNMEGGPVSLMAANDSYLFVVTANGLIYRSSDDGNNWEAVKNPYNGSNYTINKIAVGGNVVVLCSYSSFYVSPDNGNTWNASNINNLIISSILIDDENLYFNNNSNYYYYNYQLYTFSFDGKYLNTLLPCNASAVLFLAQKNSMIIAASNKGVATSTNHGKKWVYSDTGLIKNKTINNLFVLGDNIYVKYDNYLIFESTDNGRHWDTSKTIKYIDVKQIAVNGNNIFYISNYNTLFISTDGGKNWSKSDKGMTENNVKSILVKNKSVFALTDNYIYKYSEADRNWNRINPRNCFRNAYCVAGIGTRLFSYYPQTGILSTTDNGLSWDTSNISLQGRIVNSFAVHNNDIYALTDSGIYTITSESNKWVIIKGTTIAPNAKAMVFIDDMMYVLYSEYGMYKSPIDNVQLQYISKELYSSKYTGLTSFGNSLFVSSDRDGVYRSDNFGINWSQPNKGLETHLNVSNLCSSWKYVYALAGNMKYKDNSGPIFLTTNNGTKWLPVNNGIDSGVSITCIAVRANKVFAGTNNQGVYYSTDFGSNWQKLNDGLKNYNINYLSVVGPDVYAGTKGGIFKYPSLLDVENEAPVTSNLDLRSCPNPFTDNTILVFNNESPGRLDITLHDIFGREVRNIFSGIIKAGEQNFDISSDGLNAGIYFVRVQRGNDVKVMKIELIR